MYLSPHTVSGRVTNTAGNVGLQDLLASLHVMLCQCQGQQARCIAHCMLPAPDPVLHVSALVCRGAVADACLGLALCPTGKSYFFFRLFTP